MTIAFDAVSSVTPGTGFLSWVHSPVANPAGVAVLIAQDASVVDQILRVQYGALNLPRIVVCSGGTTESGEVYAYFAGSGIPTGNQTVTISTNATGSTKAAIAVTVTAAASHWVFVAATENKSINALSLAAPTAVCSVIPASGGNYMVLSILHTGLNAPTSITAGTSYTSIGVFDFGTAGMRAIRTTNPGTAGNMTYAFTSPADDAHAVGLAIGELQMRWQSALDDRLDPVETGGFVSWVSGETPGDLVFDTLESVDAAPPPRIVSQQLDDAPSLDDGLYKTQRQAYADMSDLFDSFTESRTAGAVDDAALSDAVAATRSAISSDDVAAADDVSTSNTLALVPADQPATADATTALSAKTIEDTPSLSDLIVAQRSASVSDLAETADTAVLLNARALDDSPDTSDALRKSQLSVFPDLAETDDSNTSETYTPGQEGPVINARTFDDILDLDDSFGKRQTSGLAEETALDDAVTPATIAGLQTRTFDDVAALADRADKVQAAVFAESTALADQPALGRSTAIAEQAALSDSADPAIFKPVQATDAPSIADDLQKRRLIGADDAPAPSDLLVKGTTRVIAEQAALADTAATVKISGAANVLTLDDDVALYVVATATKLGITGWTFDGQPVFNDLFDGMNRLVVVVATATALGFVEDGTPYRSVLVPSGQVISIVPTDTAALLDIPYFEIPLKHFEIFEMLSLSDRMIDNLALVVQGDVTELADAAAAGKFQSSAAADSMDLADALVVRLASVVADDARLSDLLEKLSGRQADDRASVADATAAARSTGLQIADLAELADSVVRASFGVLADRADLADEFMKRMTATQTDSPAVPDRVDKALWAILRDLAELADVADAIRMIGVQLVPNDLVEIADDFRKLRAAIHNDDASADDTALLAGFVAAVGTILDDAVPVGDAATAFRVASVVCGDFADELGELLAKILAKTLADDSDAMDAVVQRLEAVSDDSSGAEDGLAKAVLAELQEQASLSDTAALSRLVVRFLNDNPSVLDQARTSFVAIFGDSLGTDDEIRKAMVRVLSEDASLLDFVVGSVEYGILAFPDKLTPVVNAPAGGAAVTSRQKVNV